MMKKNLSTALRGILLAVVLLVQGLPAQAKDSQFDKANFTNPLDIDNPYMPLEPGTRMIYEGNEKNKSTYQEFLVTNETKTILGITARVVQDTNWVAGKLVEVTYDWFAQDDSGNVWYLGEFATDYKNGKVIGHEGSWEAGVDGAQPGIIMLAHPKVGDTYQQENAPGIAEDTATVLSLNASLCVSYGCFSNVLQTREFSPLEPDVAEHKFYAPGIGHIASVMVEGGEEESELVEVK